MLDYSDKLNDLINSDVSVIEVITYEWQRLDKAIAKCSENQHRQLLIYSPTRGLRIRGNNAFSAIYGDDIKLDTFIDVLTFFQDKAKDANLLIEDAEEFLNERSFDNIRIIKEIAKDKTCKPLCYNKSLILQTTSKILPDTLRKEVSALEIPYASREDIKDVFDDVIIDIKHDYPKAKIFYEECIGESLLGLSETEINRVLRTILNTCGQITKEELPFFLKEKEKIIAQNSFMELVESKTSLSDVGGLNSLKSWANSRKVAFSNKAKNFGLETPKGIMLLGIPGCGKSLVCKAIAHDWNYPLLRLDFGRLYHRYLGDSEANMRQAIQVAEAMSPCVLWVDEIEKGIAGAGRSDDNGVASRLFGAFLTWMQEKEKPVFIVATANHIQQIPTELFRKGRFDEIFFLDLPNNEERKDIIKIHIDKKHKSIDDVNIDQLATLSEGFSGAEIESSINDALFIAFENGMRRVNQQIINEAFKATCPLSRSMPESIDSIRVWGNKSIKPAR